MGQSEQLRSVFREICEISERRHAAPAFIKPGDPEGVRIRKRLRSFADLAFSHLAEGESPFAIAVAKGMGALPRVLWVALVPRGRRVSNSASVAVCFGIRGEGAVARAMDSASDGRWFSERKRRSGDRNMKIDVNGRRPNVNYNDKFINPVEYLATSNLAGFSDHIDSSVRLLEQFVKEKLGQLNRA